jgi:hypothetical protein
MNKVESLLERIAQNERVKTLTLLSLRVVAALPKSVISSSKP